MQTLYKNIVWNTRYPLRFATHQLTRWLHKASGTNTLSLHLLYSHSAHFHGGSLYLSLYPHIVVWILFFPCTDKFWPELCLKWKTIYLIFLLHISCETSIFNSWANIASHVHPLSLKHVCCHTSGASDYNSKHIFVYDVKLQTWKMVK